MSFGSYPFVVRSFYPFLYHDPTPFEHDAELLREVCDINRTPNAWDAMYWMQRALNFDFAIPDVLRIKSATVPTLIVWGRADRVVGLNVASRFQNDISGSQLVVVDDAGHMVHEEKPEPVNRAILSFLQSARQ
jgi:pimeloyl-ACP methyl ester carboxylesterase